MTVRTISPVPAVQATSESSTPWCAVIVIAAAALGMVLTVLGAVQLLGALL